MTEKYIEFRKSRKNPRTRNKTKKSRKNDREAERIISDVKRIKKEKQDLKIHVRSQKNKREKIKKNVKHTTIRNSKKNQIC